MQTELLYFLRFCSCCLHESFIFLFSFPLSGVGVQDQPHHYDHGLRLPVRERQPVVQEPGQADPLRQRPAGQRQQRQRPLFHSILLPAGASQS